MQSRTKNRQVTLVAPYCPKLARKASKTRLDLERQRFARWPLCCCVAQGFTFRMPIVQAAERPTGPSGGSEESSHSRQTVSSAAMITGPTNSPMKPNV